MAKDKTTGNTILQFNSVYLHIPRNKIIQLYYKHMHLTNEEAEEIRACQLKCEEKIYQLQHLASIIDRILLKE